MRARTIKVIFMSLLSACMICGCAGDKEDNISTENATQSSEQVIPASEVSTELAQNSNQEAIDTSDTPKAEKNGFTFADIAGWDFVYSSGAGGWSTELEIKADGSFSGHYHDSEMGSVGDEYPNGTIYLCDFTGEFAEPVRVNEYTYATKIESIKLEKESGTEEIKEQTKYIYSEPNGLEDAENILIYLKGAPVSKLPEEYKQWAVYSDDAELPYYGLYNEKQQNGFSSSDNGSDKSNESEKTNDGDKSNDSHLSEVEKKASDLEQKLQTENMTQMEMNKTSAEIFKLWDDELNSIWSQLKKHLDKDAMAKLLEDQRKWISNKEKEVTKAGAEAEGGSMQPLLENDKAAELTKKRVYELADMLR